MEINVLMISPCFNFQFGKIEFVILRCEDLSLCKSPVLGPCLAPCVVLFLGRINTHCTQESCTAGGTLRALTILCQR